jgi:hypothetical protein
MQKVVEDVSKEEIEKTINCLTPRMVKKDA